MSDSGCACPGCEAEGQLRFQSPLATIKVCEDHGRELLAAPTFDDEPDWAKQLRP